MALTLARIVGEVSSHESDIMQLMAGGKGQGQNAVREVVVREVMRAADGLLWCPEYMERARSEQQLLVFTGSHWERVEGQQWKDFVALCAARCGVHESLSMNPVFMRALIESVAYNLSAYRRQLIPDGTARRTCSAIRLATAMTHRPAVSIGSGSSTACCPKPTHSCCWLSLSATP